MINWCSTHITFGDISQRPSSSVSANPKEKKKRAGGGKSISLLQTHKINFLPATLCLSIYSVCLSLCLHNQFSGSETSERQLKVGKHGERREWNEGKNGTERPKWKSPTQNKWTQADSLSLLVNPFQVNSVPSLLFFCSPCPVVSHSLPFNQIDRQKKWNRLANAFSQGPFPGTNSHPIQPASSELNDWHQELMGMFLWPDKSLSNWCHYYARRRTSVFARSITRELIGQLERIRSAIGVY